MSLLTIIAALVFNGSDAKAQTKKNTDNSSLLYEITGKNLKKPSYLFGTIHLICENDMNLTEKLSNYLGQTEQLMLEINLNDQMEIQTAAKGAVMPDGKTMKTILKPEEYAKVDEVYKNYLGISYDQLQTIKTPMATTLLLTSAKGMGCHMLSGGYDKFLAQTAAANKLPVFGLETATTQIAVIDSQPFEKQVEVLNRAAANPEKRFADFKKVHQTYLAQNPDELYAIMLEQLNADGMSPETFLDKRNVSWIPVIEKNIQSKSSFIGMGAAHLGGEKGVLNLLRKKGYTVKPIKL